MNYETKSETPKEKITYAGDPEEMQKMMDEESQKDAVASAVDAFVMCEDCERPWVCGDADECCRQCVICCGEGTVDGSDYGDPLWDDDYFDPFATCPSCGGSGLAKDMQWC